MNMKDELSKTARVSMQSEDVFNDFNAIACSTFAWWAAFLNPYKPTVYFTISKRQFCADERNVHLFEKKQKMTTVPHGTPEKKHPFQKYVIKIRSFEIFQ